MKILKLILKNFASISVTMNTDKIVIDFSKCINKICLIVGPNGSGKTSILSMLHPFAEIGNLDVRNSNSLILDGREGYKEIIIKKGNDIYTIKHYYTPHSGKNHSVKSYISKNDVELNINGNVTSFKEYVKDELQIETEYLKLIRLGSNVSSLISLSTTERKNFMGKIMDDIGIFLEYYKSVNNKLRQLDDLLSHSIDKEKKLGIIDKDEYQKEIDELENKKEKEEKEYIHLNNNKAIILSELEKIEDKEKLYSLMIENERKYKKMSKLLENKKNFESLDADFYKNKLNEETLVVKEKENESSSLLILIQNELGQIDKYQDQLNTYKIELDKEMNADKEIVKLEDQIKDVRKQLREYEKTIGDFIPKINKKDLEDFISFIHTLIELSSNMYEFGKEPIKKVIDLLSKKKNVNQYIDSHLLEIDEKSGINSASVFINKISKFINKNENIPEDCDKSCPAKQLYTHVKTLLEDSKVNDKIKDSDFYILMKSVYDIINLFIDKISLRSDIIEQLPEELKKEFITKSLFDKFVKTEVPFSIYIYNDLLSITSEYDSYQKLNDEYNKLEKTLSLVSSTSKSGTIKKFIEDLENSIDESNEKLITWKNKLTLLKEIIDENKKSIEIDSEILETLEKFDEVKELYLKYTKDFESYKSMKDELSFIEINLTRSKGDIDTLNSKIQEMTINLSQLKDLQKDIGKMNKIYDEMLLVKDSLSSKQGIPLYFMSNYLSNTENITNELLSIAYDNEIYIDAFDITPTEFAIPFVNKGVRLSDVKYASQGELSFLSIALSFALSSQALNKYNIMLLDEIDGPLDTSNREKFIRILENQIDRIDAEQSFLITHNSMFSSYPVDILDLSFSNDHNEYQLANYISIER